MSQDTQVDVFASDDIATRAFGGVAASGLFELRASAQMNFQVSGGCNADRPTNIATVLMPPTGPAIQVSGAEVGLGRNERFAIQCAASLLLNAGIYRWRTIVVPNTSDGLAHATLSASAVVSPAPLQTRGVQDAFSVVSGPAGREVFAEGEVQAVMQDGEKLTATIAVVNLATGHVFPSPPIEVIGPTPQPFGTGVIPYVLAAGQMYRAALHIDYRGRGPVRCVLRQRFG